MLAYQEADRGRGSGLNTYGAIVLMPPVFWTKNQPTHHYCHVLLSEWALKAGKGLYSRQQDYEPDVKCK